jgi:hypothetical protein
MTERWTICVGKQARKLLRIIGNDDIEIITMLEKSEKHRPWTGGETETSFAPSQNLIFLNKVQEPLVRQVPIGISPHLFTHFAILTKISVGFRVFHRAISPRNRTHIGYLVATRFHSIARLSYLVQHGLGYFTAV